MPVLVPRVCTIGVRLSEEEYEAIKKFCVESGARSISDLARTALFAVVKRENHESEPVSTGNRNAAHIKRLEMRIARLSGEIAALRATAQPRAEEVKVRDRRRRSPAEIDASSALSQKDEG